MSVKLFLGEPSTNIKEWIKNQKLKEPLCFTAVDPGATITFKKVGSPTSARIVTSTNGQNWTPYTFGTTITLANVGDKVYFRAVAENNRPFYRSGSHYYKFATTDGKRIAASGNIQTLIKADGSRLDISGKTYCYTSIFQGCTSLTTAPELPATTLADGCYSSMFRNCKSVTVAPSLPATTLVNSCYSNMFNGCTSLTSAPELPVTTLVNYCYSNMFNGCTSLTTAPALPAATLVDYCYYCMFQNCSNLASIDVNFTAWDPTNATTNWVNGVAASGTFTCPSILPKTTGNNNIPSGWTIVEK